MTEGDVSENCIDKPSNIRLFQESYWRAKSELPQEFCNTSENITRRRRNHVMTSVLRAANLLKFVGNEDWDY